MFNNKVSKAVRLAIAFGTASTAVFSANSFAAEEEKIERIEVTGSAIKRTDMEGALPVQVVDRATIDRSGVSSVADLVQQLPSMQGFTTPASTVGGGGGGTATASLRDLGESYTLVLLNGRRLAPRGSGSTIDLNSIPLALIERVEILTDGASAIYGSDAIAGVINFILKDSVDQTTVAANYTSPQESGGDSYSYSITTGFGDFDADGFNVTASYSYDRKDKLKATDRDFAKSGIIPFKHNGDDKYFLAASSNAIPANTHIIYNQVDANGKPVLDEDGDFIQQRIFFNPYFETNGQCAPSTAKRDDFCVFDFTSTLEIYPESDRDSFMLNTNFAVTDDIKFFTEASYTDFVQTSRIAPYPTGTFLLSGDQAQYVIDIAKNLKSQDSLTDAEVDNIIDNGVRAAWRVLPSGNRTNEWNTKSTHFVAGFEGTLFDTVDFDTAFIYSKNDSTQTYLGGYPLSAEFREILGKGEIDIFADATDQETLDKNAAALEPAMFKGKYSNSTTEMKAFNFKASMPVFELPEGEVYAAFGVDYRDYDYSFLNEAVAREATILFEQTGTDYGLQRDNLGIFTELYIPVIEGLELTAAARYDKIGAVDGYSKRYLIGGEPHPENKPAGTISDSMNDTTYKLGVRYQLNDNWLLRGGFGTGFKAPSMTAIGQPLVNSGVTSNSYRCDLTGVRDDLAKLCQSTAIQYGVFRGGNVELKPETSEQSTLGFVYSPSNEFGVTVDYWSVNIENQVSSLSQNQIFGDPAKYADLFTSRPNSSTGESELAIKQVAVNIGKSENSGIDYSVNLLNELSFGTLSTRLQGTYFIEARYTSPGTDGSQPEDWLTSMNQFGTNNAVTFRNVLSLSNTLSHGDFSHTVNLNYRNGYMDQVQRQGTCLILNGKPGDEAVCSTDVTRRVPAYTKVDYQLSYSGIDDVKLAFGINNLFDKQPPFTIRSAGAGHQRGYDPRYHDVFGRTFYLNASYSF
mgnify:CR=1 FL=1